MNYQNNLEIPLGRTSAPGPGGHFITYVKNGKVIYRHVSGMEKHNNGKLNHVVLTPMLRRQRAHQIILKYAQKRKNQIYNPYTPAGRKFILKQAGFNENQIRNYEKNRLITHTS